MGSEVPKEALTGRARSLANLKPIQKGQRLNPTGMAGRGVTRREVFARLLEQPDDDKPELTRFQALVLAMIQSGKTGDSVAGKAIVTEYLPKKAPDPSTLDYAEHFRQIEADRIKMAIALLGDRVKTMTSEEIANHLALCRQNSDAFIEMAKRIQGTVDEPPEQVQEIGATASAPRLESESRESGGD